MLIVDEHDMNDLRHALWEALNKMQRLSPDHERIWENGRKALAVAARYLDEAQYGGETDG